MSKKLSPEDFARTSRSLRGGSQCRTCVNPAWKDAIRRILKVWATEDGCTPSFVAMTEYLQGSLDYPHSEHALRNHVRAHEHELWEQVKKRNSI